MMADGSEASLSKGGTVYGSSITYGGTIACEHRRSACHRRWYPLAAVGRTGYAGLRALRAPGKNGIRTHDVLKKYTTD